jgi:hypothetical protein
MDLYVSWSSEGSVGCAIRAATDELRWAENLWFVDYRIQRKPHALPATTTTTSRHQFHGNSCRFTEVREGDTDWNVNSDPDIFMFVYDLNDKVDEYFQNQQK